MGISKITRNFQITLPRDIRELKHFKVGDKLLFVVENERIDLVKMDKEVIRAAGGIWKEMKEDGLAYERKLRNEWMKRERREMR